MLKMWLIKHAAFNSLRPSDAYMRRWTGSNNRYMQNICYDENIHNLGKNDIKCWIWYAKNVTDKARCF